jgi:hypothetical protein
MMRKKGMHNNKICKKKKKIEKNGRKKIKK